MTLKAAHDIKELRAQFNTIKSTVAGDTRFGAQAILFVAERLVSIEALLAKGQAPKKRAPSAWQRFFAAGMKAGKTPAEIGREWRSRKSAGTRR
jgi:hypothetical protein